MMIRKYRNRGIAAVGVAFLSVVGLAIFGKELNPFLPIPGPVEFLFMLASMVALFCAALFFTKAKGYPWALGFVIGASIFIGGLGVVALVVLVLLPDRPPPPAQHT